MRQIPHDFFIFYEQNGLFSSHRAAGFTLVQALVDNLVDSRQVNLEDRPFAEFAVNPNVAATLFHDAVDSGQTQASAFANLLGGEERLEDMRFRFGVHAATGVGDRHNDVVPRLYYQMALGKLAVQVNIFSSNTQCSASRHGITCVYGEV